MNYCGTVLTYAGSRCPGSRATAVDAHSLQDRYDVVCPDLPKVL
jgi:hypothetical protein